MFAFLSSGTELRRFRKGALPKIAVAVLLFIPLIYGALYLWAFWAPTDELRNLPVALVNEDTGAVNDGERLLAGNDVVDKLVDGKDLDWHQTDAADAAAGVSNGEYYFSLTIPANFSASAISAGTDLPQSAVLQVNYNDSNSFLASTLGKSAMAQVREAVAVNVGEQTVNTLLVGLHDAGAGIRDAADGATQLANGLDTAKAGAGDLVVGLASLADGTATLNSGAGKLDAGATTLTDGLATLSSGAATLSDKSGELATGAGQLAAGATGLAAGTGAVATGTSTVSDSVTKLIAAINAAPAGTPAAAFLPALGELQVGAGKVAAGAADANAGAGQVSGAASALANGSAQLSAGAGQIAGGLSSAHSGAAALSAGASDLSAGTQTLADGSQALLDGGSKLESGAGQLVDGSHTLATALTDGAEKIPNDSDGLISQKSVVIADPVSLDQTWDNESAGFGEGFAPFFIALATFVGALITWLILRALPTRALATSASGIRTIMTGFLPAMAIGLGQVVIMVLVLVYGIGLEPTYWLGMSAFMYLAALAFLAVQQMFIVLLGSAAGRVVSLVLLMMMLTSSGGTYPVETTPEFFQALHPFMPASWVVTGLRELITGGIDYRLWVSVASLAALLIGSLAISAWSAGKQRMWTIKRLHPELTI
ncbi:YhgE/Pip family protein [Glaciibacter psychrotolerans]|uniref:Putative membrane protein n=1 Tax=Glaciibacter psychrotolerans TaxID=670054 RepID=A0A7Z0EHC9_9MICO|nr:YhgE/Pip domain-containing protein [Leifsonia psychrotolerans]NYJ21265.1 putative membrane protein [Leifsonia psychrotolerans]